MRLTTKALLIHSLLLAWFILCLAFFGYIGRVSFLQIFTFTGWRPFAETLTRVAPLRYILDLFRAWLGTTLFSFACLSLGLRTMQKWVKVQSPDLALGVTAFVVGEILFSLIFLTVISAYRLTPVFVGISLTLGFLAGFSPLKSFVAHLPRPGLPADFGRYERIILGLVVGVFAIGLSYSSARLGYDAAAEYFSHAKIMAVSQLPIFFYPNDSFVVSSFHPGILFTALIQLFGDQSARLLPWFNGGAILLMGVGLGGELGLTTHARLWFLTLMVTTTAFMDLLGDGKIELISTAPLLAAVYWMLRGLKQPTKYTFALIGLLNGFALISRPYNIFLVSVFIALFYAGQIYMQKIAGRRPDFKQLIQSALWLLLPILILGVFHLVENWFFLKSPLAPLTYAQSLSTKDWQWQFSPADLAYYRLLYPLTVTFLNSPQSLGNISPFFVAFLPFLLIREVRENLRHSLLVRQLSLAAALTLLLWISFFFTVVEIRYVLFLWTIVFLSMAPVLESTIQNVEMLIRPALRIMLIILLAYAGMRTLLIALATYSPLDGNGQAHCYDLDLCTFLELPNRIAAPGDRVLVLNAYRYYLRPDLFACSSRSEEYSALQELARQNSPDFWTKIYQHGYRFLTYEENFTERHTRFGKIVDPKNAPSWLHVTVLSSTAENAEVVYLLEAVNPPHRPDISCTRKSDGTWQLAISSAQ